jgi:hypothetical protein
MLYARARDDHFGCAREAIADRPGRCDLIGTAAPVFLGFSARIAGRAPERRRRPLGR